MTHGDPKHGGRHGDEGLRIGREGLKPVFDFINSCGETPYFLWYAADDAALASRSAEAAARQIPLAPPADGRHQVLRDVRMVRRDVRPAARFFEAQGAER